MLRDNQVTQSGQNKIDPNKLIQKHDSQKTYMWAILANLLVQIVLQLVMISAIPDIDFAEEVILSLVIMLAIQFAYLFVYLKVIVYEKKASKFSLKKINKPQTYVFAVIATTLLFVGMFLPTMFVTELLALTGYSATSFTFETVAEFIFGIFVIAILAPIIEELIFRGVILSGFYSGEKKTKAVIKAAVIAGALFALSHMSPAQTFYQFFLGGLCGIFVIYTGSVLLGIVVHMTSNVVALIVSYTALIDVVEVGYAYLCDNVLIAVVVTILLLAVCITAIIFILCYVKRQENFDDEKSVDDVKKADNTLDNRQKMIQQVYARAGRFYLIIGICISALMWVIQFVA